MGDIQKPQQQQQPQISPHLLQLLQAFLQQQPQVQQHAAPEPYTYQRKGPGYVQPADPYTGLAFQRQRVNPVTGEVEYIDMTTAKDGDWTTAQVVDNPMLDREWRKAYQLQGLHPSQQALYEWDDTQGYWVLPEEVQANYDFTPFGGWVPRGTQAQGPMLQPIDLSGVLGNFLGNTTGRPSAPIGGGLPAPLNAGGNPALRQPLATMAGNPNPMDKVLGGPAGMNPFRPKRQRYGML